MRPIPDLSRFMQSVFRDNQALNTTRCMSALRVNSCKTPFDCTSTTRPYAVFFTQAASCMDAVICD
jgi:hypothetical protein